MIKDNNNYLYLIVPNEYRCVYYNILDTLGTLGEDLINSCTATCKGRAISGFACYNMFIAACAAYYLGQIKKARVLISYIKAQLEINCDKILIFEDSLSDEWIYLTVPKAYQCVFEKLLNKLATWGQELLDDCTVSCKGQNRNILNAWNLFNAACIAYNTSATNKSDYIVDYVKGLLGFNCPAEDDYNTPVLKNFVLDVIYSADGPMIDIEGATVSYENENNLVRNSLKLINTNNNEVVVSYLPISRNIDLDIPDYVGEPGETIGFVLEATDIKGSIIRSNVYNVVIPNVEPGETPTIRIKSVNIPVDANGTSCEIHGLTAVCTNIDKFNSNGLSAYVKTGGGAYQLIQNHITPEHSLNIEFEEIPVYDIGPDGLEILVKLSGTGKDNIDYYDTYYEVLPGNPDVPSEPDDPDDPDGPQPYPDDPDEPVDPAEPAGPAEPGEPGGSEEPDPIEDNTGDDNNAEETDLNNGDNPNPQEPAEPGT